MTTEEGEYDYRGIFNRVKIYRYFILSLNGVSAATISRIHVPECRLHEIKNICNVYLWN